MGMNSNITIVGGGLNGCALALACAQVGFQVILLDQSRAQTQKSENFDGRAYALALTTVRMLRALDLWDSVAQHAQPILDIKVSDGRAGDGASPYYLHFDHRELDEGPMGHMLEDRYLRIALMDQMETHKNISYFPETKVVDQIQNAGAIQVVLDDGRQIKTQLLVGCDGRQSGVATRAGIKRSGWDYDQASLVCAIEHALPHNGIAHQFFTPSGPLAILPLTGNRSSIVWTEQKTRAVEISQMDSSEYLDCLRPVFGNFLGDIKLAGDRFMYPLGLSLAQQFVMPHVALVGDAAHGIHPLAGQGLNLGLRDVGALAETLANAKRRGEDIGALNVLQRYQSWRRFDATGMAVATDSINRIFSNDNGLLRTIRDLGLGAVNAMPNTRRGFMRHAAGLSGNLPKLMQGRQI
ncbi:2-octaprenyl-6-methoxyphenyl hydroxylase [Amylibacter kogurei]|uniref:2-octaprenyl-6-methoxyphenyl hydroxylase n=1 Tax=Paramylibacter kogurei TaxID=1889778 RepID=A0A2G5K0L7_9RHOB|nr:FAD-dependent monooxygenase [Amylibacter kogurei]PIB23076.1 2-octaprenyl-6-methoxyphenyl hydroxylase [Amylibacter kogurei]